MKDSGSQSGNGTQGEAPLRARQKKAKDDMVGSQAPLLSQDSQEH